MITNVLYCVWKNKFVCFFFFFLGKWTKSWTQQCRIFSYLLGQEFSCFCFYLTYCSIGIHTFLSVHFSFISFALVNETTKVCFLFPLSDDTPEFVLLNKEPEPDPEDPSKLVYTEDPLILHTRTGRIINYIDDEEHGVRLFWQPPLKEGEDVDPEKAEFLPLGFDEFYGREKVVKEESMWTRLLSKVENACKPTFDRLKNWLEEKRKERELKMELLKKEFELIDAELSLEEAIEDIDEELRIKEKEEEKKMEVGEQEREDTDALADQDERAPVKEGEGEGEEEEEDGDEEEDEEEDDAAPSSFGSVSGDQNPSKNDSKRSKPGQSPFSATSLSFPSSYLVSGVSSKLITSHKFDHFDGFTIPLPYYLMTCWIY